MIAYVDSSVLLRVVLAQPRRLAEWSQLDQIVTSALTEVECLRSLDRYMLRGELTQDLFVERRSLTLTLLARFERIDLTAAVLRRAAEPFPTPLGSLDAIHLSSALLWASGNEDELHFATHDRELHQAARAMGFPVLGF